MRHGEVYKKNSAWWYTKQTEGSPLRLSTKHTTKAKALAVAEDDGNLTMIGLITFMYGRATDHMNLAWQYANQIRRSDYEYESCSA